MEKKSRFSIGGRKIPRACWVLHRERSKGDRMEGEKLRVSDRSVKVGSFGWLRLVGWRGGSKRLEDHIIGKNTYIILSFFFGGGGGGGGEDVNKIGKKGSIGFQETTKSGRKGIEEV